MGEMFRENRESENKKVADPGFFFMDTVRQEIAADRTIDWEEYKKSITELLYSTVVKGDPEEIKKILLQVKRFDELRLVHKRRNTDLIQASGEE